MKKLIISTCGTSLLTNKAPFEVQKILRETANSSEKELTEEQKKAIDLQVSKQEEMLSNATFKQARELSAELNGILGIYNNKLALDISQDMHFLIRTDTYQGQEAARLVEKWLSNKDMMVQIQNIEGLTTKSFEDFHRGILELVKWIEEIIPGYEKSGFHIVFNLVGGFKSVQGYLNTLGMFYADEIVYIFEASSSELIRIPRLPIHLDPEGVVKKQLNIFRRMSIYGEIPLNEVEGIPESLLDKRENRVGLSIWGQAVWGRSKEEYYKKELLPPPHQQIKYGNNFAKAVSEYIGTDRAILINKRIDDLGIFLNSNRKYNPNSLDFKPLQGKPLRESTHECDAWSDKDAKRIFCHWEENTLVLDTIGPKLK